jgi:hypothetical protein
MPKVHLYNTFLGSLRHNSRGNNAIATASIDCHHHLWQTPSLHDRHCHS